MLTGGLEKPGDNGKSRLSADDRWDELPPSPAPLMSPF